MKPSPPRRFPVGIPKLHRDRARRAPRLLARRKVPIVFRSRQGLPSLPGLLATGLLLLGLAAADGGLAPGVAAHGGEHSGLTAGYRLVETWQGRAWSPRAGRFGDAGDVASRPDGRIFVLDRRQNALHVLAADGRPLARWPSPAASAEGPDAAWRWIRLDAGPDGRLALLARGSFEGDAPGQRVVRYRIDLLEGEGAGADGMPALRSIALGTVSPERYVDLALGPQGSVYAVRTNGNVASRGDISYAVDILDPAGEPGGQQAWVPDNLYIPLQIEVDAAGQIYLIDQFPHTGQSQPPGTVDGIHVYAADRSPRQTIQFSGAMDLALAPDGTLYVTRNREIYRLQPGTSQTQPFHVGPPIQKNPYALTPLGVPEMFSLDVAPDGRPLAAMSHCSWQGLLIFDPARIASGAGDPLLARVGNLDAPELAGPMHPFRIDADRDASLLQARYALAGWEDAVDQQTPDPALPPPLVPVGASSSLYDADPQSIQRWTAQGALQGQAAACGVWNAPFGVRDLAVDGADTWTLDFQSLKRRSGDAPEPEPSFGFELVGDLLATPQLLAVSADDGQAALLDAGSQRVAIVDRAMQPLTSWPYATREDDGWAPTDIAMRGERVLLVARGERRVTVYDRQGKALGLWWEDRPIRAAALGPGETVLVLLDGGWLMRRAIDGEHQAMWRLPQPELSARDLAVDLAGRVYVPWVDLDPSAAAGLDAAQDYAIRAAGVWVFAPSEAYWPPSPGFVSKLEREEEGSRASCLVVAGKLAAPQILSPGGRVEVSLNLHRECAAPERELRLVLIVDSSKSMNNDNALDRARQALVGLLGRLDPLASTEVAVLAYDGEGGARLLRPFSEDLSGARRAVAEIEADGETGLGTALTLAAGLLDRAGADASASAVLWATDGETLRLGDDPSEGLQQLREAGVPVYVQLHPFRGIREAQLSSLASLFGAGRVFTHQGPESLDAQADALYRRESDPRRHARLLDFDSLRVTDMLAPGMDYIAGSAEPEAIWDPDTRRLTWMLADPGSASPLTLRYAVNAHGLGAALPISELARARWELDGELGELGFPNPTLHLRGASEILLPGLWRGAAGMPMP